MTIEIWMLTVISTYVIIFACILYTLEQTVFHKIKIVLALPVSLLCVIGLMQFTGDTQETSMFNLILIPYAALAYTFIALAILWLLSQLHSCFCKTSKKPCNPKNEK